jgi:hypothetical protein
VQLESASLVRVFLADQGTTADLRRTVDEMRAHVADRTRLFLDVGRGYTESRGAFPERAAVNFLTARLLDDVLETVDRWADWVDGVVASWPDDPKDAPVDLPEMQATVDRATQRLARHRGSEVLGFTDAGTP